MGRVVDPAGRRGGRDGQDRPRVREGGALIALALACAPLDPDEPAQFRDDLAAFAAAQPPFAWADPRASDHLSPDGVWVDPGGVVWVISAARPVQHGFRLVQGRWEPVGTRPGPLRTRRCVERWCVGEREPGGVVAVPPDPGFRSGLAPRGGYRDLAVVGGRLYVLDAVEERIAVLDATGAAVDSLPAPAAPLRMGALGEGALWVASAAPPALTAISLDTGAAAITPLVAPIRDADLGGGRLWTVGPVQARVRRDHGRLEGPGTEVLAWDVADLLAGGAAPIERRAGQGVDGTRIIATPDGPAVAYTGSDVVGWRGELVPAGLAPAGLAFVGGGLAIAARHSDALVGVGGTVVLDPSPRDTLRDAGDRLLASTALWGGAPAATCLGCHWDGGVDHRLHPGADEIRWEQIRPFAGASTLRPIFTPGQAADLAEAVEGLVRGLDDRFAAPATERWWLEGRTVQTKSGPRSLTALEVREALLAAIAAWPVDHGPLPPGDAALFERDCAGCHRDPPGRGAPLFVAAGPPAFTDRGNRVPPLWQLDRGGPYLSDGSARTLDEVLQRSGPRGHGEAGGYSAEERAGLRAFLLGL